jgi:branched-chain amino acid transport system permease protein
MRRQQLVLRKSKRFNVFLLVAVILCLVPQLGVGTYILRILILSLVFLIATSAWCLISGYAGQINLAPTMFFGLGVYSSALAARHLGLSPWLGLLIGPLLAASFALIIGFPLFRLHGAYFALATLAVGEILYYVMVNEVWFSGGTVGLQIPFTPKVLFVDFNDIHSQYYFILVLAFLSTYILYRIAMSRLGYYFMAIRDDEDTAMSMGINVFKYKEVAFCLSGFFTGLAGAFYSNFLLYVEPSMAFGITPALTIVIMGILGGADTILGAWISAPLLTFIMEGLRLLFGAAGAYDLFTLGILIILVILVIPRGLIRLVTAAKI